MGLDRNDPGNTEACPKTSGVVMGEQSDPQPPDPRWPYLGRWSKAVTPPIMSVQQKEIGVPTSFAAPPPEIIDTSTEQETGDTPPTSETVSSPRAPASTDPHPPVPVTSRIQPTDEYTSALLTDERAVVHQETNQLVTSGLTEASEKGDQEDEPDIETILVPTMGAWSKPLRFTPPPTPPEPATPKLGFTEVVKSHIACFWPTINESIVKGHKHTKEKLAYPVQTTSQLPMEKLPPPVLKEDGSLWFPWAAQMNQSSRNLFRAAEPTYRLDGTPQVTIPSNVLRLGPENKEEYIVGQFHRCTNPPGGLIHAVLNRLWGRECKISCRKLGESSYLFHIPHENTRKWVIQRGVWHVDDCLLFVAPWSPVKSLRFQLSQSGSPLRISQILATQDWVSVI
ncbi:unnamed protein product [Brassica oleracea var. botrytis]|uniref:DUF4283 domain-containing protein n=2 Tax=Brassica TaxID=3705 RepID=A0A3P6CCJ9_BRAOL|nr:unnamed protein product [Brassica napus]VDD06202.1 unnamed protein product [Brassica oleracea]